MKTIYTIIICLSFGWSFTWQFSGRTHPELNWTTMETEHFRVHYHQGIEEIAKEGASISEQVRPTLLQQMGLDNIPVIDIIFTTEDEIMKGSTPISKRRVIASVELLVCRVLTTK